MYQISNKKVRWIRSIPYISSNANEGVFHSDLDASETLTLGLGFKVAAIRDENKIKNIFPEHIIWYNFIETSELFSVSQP